MVVKTLNFAIERDESNFELLRKKLSNIRFSEPRPNYTNEERELKNKYIVSFNLSANDAVACCQRILELIGCDREAFKVLVTVPTGTL